MFDVEVDSSEEFISHAPQTINRKDNIYQVKWTDTT